MFFPTSNDPSALDRAMRESLADSLEYISTTIGNRLDVPMIEIGSALSAIRSRRVMPGVFGRYCKLVHAVQEAKFEQASRLFQRIIDQTEQIPAFTVNLYSQRSLGDDQVLYGELIDPAPGAAPWICPPAADDDFDGRVTEALRLIAVADPPLADELRGLLVQVVGAAPFHGPDARPFGSVSSLMLWGLLIVNMERYRTPADLIQGLVHEGAHLVLFAHSIDEPLVTNRIEERYKSPLRPDPRPMDGVLHATFVSARMHYVNRKLRDATCAGFEPVAVAELDSRLETLRALYFGGLQTVREHARLTNTGRRVIEESLDYMKAA